MAEGAVVTGCSLAAFLIVMVVTNPEHRKHAEEIWKIPHGTINPKVGYHAVEQNRALKDGKLNAYWVMVNNNMQAAANLLQETWPGYRNPDNFIVVSDAYPTVTAQAADLILPAAMWVEKEGAFGNAERRTQFWHQLVKAPGEARSDLWQLVEFSKRLTTDEVWPAELLANSPQHKGKTLYQVLFANGQVDQFPSKQIAAGHINDEAKAFGFYLQKGLFEEYAQFGRGHGHDLAETAIAGAAQTVQLRTQAPDARDRVVHCVADAEAALGRHGEGEILIGDVHLLIADRDQPRQYRFRVEFQVQP